MSCSNRDIGRGQMEGHARSARSSSKNGATCWRGAEGAVELHGERRNKCAGAQEVAPEAERSMGAAEEQGCRGRSLVWGANEGVRALLTFEDPVVEREFLRASTAYATGWDRVTYELCTLFAGLRLLLSGAMVASVQGVTYHALITFIGLGVPLMVLHMIENRPQFYRRNRSWLICRLRFLEVIAQTVAVLVQDPMRIWVPNRFYWMMMQAMMRVGFLSLTTTALGARLPIRFCIYVLTISSLHVFAWVHKLCIACKESCVVRENIQSLGWRADAFMTRASLLGFSVSWEPHAAQQYPCWLVGIFYGLVFQYFLPIYCIYILECCQRVSFLKELGSREEDVEYSQFKYGQIVLATVYLAICSQLLWFTLRITWEWNGDV